MAGTETITLRLVAQDLMSGNVTKAIGGLDKLARQGGLVGNVLQGVGMSMGQMLNPAGMVANAIGTVADVMGSSITAASDQAEALSKVTVVFGEQAREIEDWARTASTSMGMSETAALSAAGTLGNLFDALGLTEAATRDMSKGIVQLAADLGSFNNVATDEALTALQSGLLGETEPMRRFGANLSAARVEAYALAEGMAASKGAITEAMKVQARYELILQDTVNAQGDFARTADGLANSQKALDAKIADLNTSLGELLQGPAAGFVSFLSGVVDVLSGPKGVNLSIRETADAIRALGQAAESVVEMDALNDQIERWSTLIRDSEFRNSPQVFEWMKRLGPEALAGLARASVETSAEIENLAQTMAGEGKTFEQWEASVRRSVMGTDDYLRNILPGAFAIAASASSEGTDDIVKDIGKLGIRMRTSMASWRDEFVSDWKDLAEAIKNPFTPKKLANLIDDYAEKAARNAARAARENKPNVARRWREVADVMKSPVLAGLVEIGMGVDDAVNAILLVRQMGQTLRGATSPLRDALGNLWGNSGGGGVNADGSPNRHAGGPVMAGRSYTVGGPGAEERLTMFPGGGGHVTPLQGGRGGGGTAVHVHFHGVVAAPSEADIDRMGRQLEPVIRRAMAGAA